jgi:hypothetical protein
MKRSVFLRGLVMLAALILVQHPETAKACAVCMGADSHNGEALNGAIFFMLGLLAVVFTGIGAVAFSIARRARRPVPEHAEFTDPFQPQANAPLS